jgi:hypothetical protein
MISSSIKPSQSISAKIDYDIELVTADRIAAGTDANLTIVITGSHGHIGPIDLSSKMSGDPFESGDIDRCRLRGQKNIGQISKVIIKSDRKGLGSDWKLDSLRIRPLDGNDTEYAFSTDQWIEDQPDDTYILTPQIAPAISCKHWYTIQSNQSKKLLTIEGPKPEDIGFIMQPTFQQGGRLFDPQVFRFELNDDGTYGIYSRFNRRMVAVLNAAKADNTPIIQWDFTLTDNQKFKVEPQPNGTYRLIAKHSNKPLSITANQLNVVQVSKANRNSEFVLTPVASINPKEHLKTFPDLEDQGVQLASDAVLLVAKESISDPKQSTSHNPLITATLFGSSDTSCRFFHQVGHWKQTFLSLLMTTQ